MSNVSLNLPDDLRLQVAMAARELGISPDAFMVEAISRATNAVERRCAFLMHGRLAKDEMRREGLGYDAGEVVRYLRQRASGTQLSRPAKRIWRDKP